MTLKYLTIFGAVLAASAVVPTHAQVRQTPIYYDEHNTQSCAAPGATTSCTLDFSQLPATQQVEFTNVSCNIAAAYASNASTAPIRAPTLGVTASGSGGALITSQKLANITSISESSQGTTTITSTVVTPVRFAMGAGRYPRISVDLPPTNPADSLSLDCTIVGTPRTQ